MWAEFDQGPGSIPGKVSPSILSCFHNLELSEMAQIYIFKYIRTIKTQIWGCHSLTKGAHSASIYSETPE